MVDVEHEVEHEVELPAGLVERRSDEERAELRAWWASLAHEERASLRALWGDENDDVVLAVVDHGELAVLLEARFVDPGLPDDGITREPEEEWLTKDAFFEWIWANPEMLPTKRPVHVCSAHAEARAVLRRGRLPAGFACPLAREGCPMRRLLARRPGCDVVLTAVRRAAAP